MKRFGYFGKPTATQALLTEEAVVQGLMKLQAFARLPPTGRIDEATLKVTIFANSKSIVPIIALKLASAVRSQQSCEPRGAAILAHVAHSARSDTAPRAKTI